MIKSKFNKNLINKVKTLKDEKFGCVVESTNLKNTEDALKMLNINFKAYPFMNCFYVNSNFQELSKLSEVSSVSMLSSTTKVNTLIHNTKQFLNVDALYENKYYGKTSTIAFIDTGIAPHLDFLLPTNRIIDFKDFVNNKTIPYDDNGHGTFVASVCLGSGKSSCNKYSGIAPMANIVMVKALDKNGETDSNKILDAMQYIYDNKEKFNIKVVCMSFGAESIGSNDPLQKGALALWNKGIVVVAAAGNSGPEKESIKSPGANSKIITVGSLDISNVDELKIAEFSSRGPANSRFKPDLLAPGVSIVGANNNIKTPYIKMSGTSVSAPIVSGIVAILLDKNKNLTPDRIKYLLTSKCKPLTKEKNNEGFGYLQF